MDRKKVMAPTQSDYSPSVRTVRDIFVDFSLKDFFEVFEEFYKLKSLEGLSLRSLEDYRNHLEYFKTYCFEYERISTVRCVDSDLLRGYLYFLIHEKEYKSATVNIRLRTLRAYLKWLFKEEYIPRDFSEKLKLVKEPIDTVKPLSDEEVKRLLKMPNRGTYAGYRDFTIMILMLDTGIRVTECMNLKIEDVDLSSRIILVRAESAKTRVARQLPISKKTCKLLRALILKAKESHYEFIFMSAFGNRLTRNQVNHNFKKYANLAEIKGRCSPHNYRHTFATNFIRAGGDPFALQRILGHTTMEMTRRYIQLRIDDLSKKHTEARLLERYIK